MSSSHVLSEQPWGNASRQLPWQFRAQPALAWTVSTIVGALLVLGLLICARRLAGALTAELAPGTVLLTALFSMAAVSWSRIAWRRSFPIESPEELGYADRLLGWTSSVALVLLAVGCCYPGYRTVDWMIWLPIWVADQFWRQSFFDAGIPTPEPALDETPIASTLTLAATAPQDDIVQQLYRLRDEHHEEVIYGTVRADFVAGQRHAVLHVGFCPPLNYIPEIEAEALPGTFAQTKVVQALAHGTRLDIRLASVPKTDCHAWIDLAARPAGSAVEAKIA